jgi:leucyl aminopeptidase (aminopeptidase T)
MQGPHDLDASAPIALLPKEAVVDPRLSNLADVLVNCSLKVRPGQWAAIRGPSVALPLMEECVRYTLRAGCQARS